MGRMAEELTLKLAIVKHTDEMQGFVVLPRIRVVEHALAWITRWHRCVRDYGIGRDPARFTPRVKCRVLDPPGYGPPQPVTDRAGSVSCWSRRSTTLISGPVIMVVTRAMITIIE
jgi:hypothetical protein